MSCPANHDDPNLKRRGFAGTLRYIGEVNFITILAVSVGIAMYRGIVAPALDRYRTWKSGPRLLVARRNWRGIYVPDLTVKRGERIFWLCYLAIVVIGLAVGWTIMVPGPS